MKMLSAFLAAACLFMPHGSATASDNEGIPSQSEILIEDPAGLLFPPDHGGVS